MSTGGPEKNFPEKMLADEAVPALTFGEWMKD
jgi:hypothetical protein